MHVSGPKKETFVINSNDLGDGKAMIKCLTQACDEKYRNMSDKSKLYVTRPNRLAPHTQWSLIHNFHIKQD